MNPSSPRPAKRAPRADLRGTISVLIQLENLRRIPGKLHRLSITGGLLEIVNSLDERAKVGLTIALGSCVVHPKAEMLFPMRGVQGYLQPFRFTSVSGEDLQILDKEITELLKQAASTASVRGSGFRPSFYLDSF